MNHEVKIYEQAELDYMDGLKYKDIASKYSVSINTVKSWKTRYNWNRKDKKSVHTKKEKVCVQKEVAKEVVEQVIETEELSDKEQLFCLYYIRCFNATKAYMKSHDVKYESAAVLGCRLLKQEKIQNTIKELKQNRLNREMLSEEDIFQKYMDIAFADMSDYFEFGSSNNVNHGNLKSSDEVDGTLISEIKISTGKTHSVQVKLLDRMKALDWLTEHMDMATEEQKARIEVLRAKTKSDEDETVEDDGFIEALEGKVDEIW
ncbi:MAG: terminase small subunit [Eubacterium sp.]